ncbi:MAG: glycosyltransferase [Clostridia bacterium]|nr:glycosyltransferase [Clostridia bacterium]
MKIAIVCDVLGKGNNGTAVVTKNLYEHLKSNGNDVKIICADQSKKNEEGYFVLPTLKLGKPLDAYVDSVGVTLAKCDKKIMDEALSGVDYIHCIMPFALGRYAANYAKEHNIPITAGFHLQAENITAHLKLNKISFLQTLIYKRLYNSFYSKMDAIHYPTQFIKDVFEKAIGKSTNGYVISNGVHEYVVPRVAVKPEEMSDKIVISNTGRYSREKSQDTLIKAIKYSKYSDKIQLILAGQGAKEKYYKRLGKSLPVPPKFGALSRDEVVNMINYSDLYVHTAEIELEGIACLEAIKCGKLTIVSDSQLSATKGFVSDKKCVYKNKDPKSLARVLDYWIEHIEENKNCKRSDSERVKYVGECMKDMDKMFNKVILSKTDSCA